MLNNWGEGRGVQLVLLHQKHGSISSVVLNYGISFFCSDSLNVPHSL